MQNKTWKYQNRTGWGFGPWSDEPDKEQWEDESTGLPCMVRRSPTMGSWCGYVAVPEGHPLREASFDEYDNDPGVEVHGGITFSGFCDGDEEMGICHVPEEGDPDPAFWVGFDCGHYRDFQPAMAARNREMGMRYINFDDEVYRTISYAKDECRKLAAQVAELA